MSTHVRFSMSIAVVIGFLKVDCTFLPIIYREETGFLRVNCTFLPIIYREETNTAAEMEQSLLQTPTPRVRLHSLWKRRFSCCAASTFYAFKNGVSSYLASSV